MCFEIHYNELFVLLVFMCFKMILVSFIFLLKNTNFGPSFSTLTHTQNTLIQGHIRTYVYMYFQITHLQMILTLNHQRTQKRKTKISEKVTNLTVSVSPKDIDYFIRFDVFKTVADLYRRLFKKSQMVTFYFEGENVILLCSFHQVTIQILYLKTEKSA